MTGATSHLGPVATGLWTVGAAVTRWVGRLVWHLTVDHAEPLPPAPFVIAGNHPSSIDPMVVGAIHRRPVMFLAVDELSGIHRSLDLALDVFGAVPVPRKGVPLGAMRTALGHLGSGGVVGVFPEGTRVPVFGDGPVKSGAAWLAARAGVPLVPVAIEGTGDVFSLDLRLGRGAISLVTGPPMVASGRSRPQVDELMDRWTEWMGRRLGGD